ncbi:MAG: hypothetical protein IPG39_21380 [Bacteroidetes bacterium]|nr:hypothetical protein [Bacteroidota bacterium]
MALLVARILSIYFTELDFYQWMIVAAITVVAGTLGDLVESMLKEVLVLKIPERCYPDTVEYSIGLMHFYCSTSHLFLFSLNR